MPLATAARSRSEARHQATPRLHHSGGAASGLRGAGRGGRPLVAATGVFLVVFCAAAGALVATRSDHRVPYLVVAGEVPENSMLAANDLTAIDITPGTGIAAVPAADESQVLGLHATEELLPGTLLSPDELSSAPTLGADRALVGATLAADQLPAGISAGDSVLVVLTDSSGAAGTSSAGSLAGGSAESAQGQPSRAGDPADATVALDGPPGTVLATATVMAVQLPATADGSPTSTDSSDVVTLAIERDVAAEVAAASASDEVSLAIVPTAGATTARARAAAPAAAAADPNVGKPGGVAS